MDLVVNGFQFDGQAKVADWYAVAFPHDEWGNEMMNKGITFQDVFECLQVGFNVYALLGAGDSVVRERVFDALATMMDVSYDVIYYQWLNHTKNPLNGELRTDLTGLRFDNGNEAATRILNFVTPYIPEHIKEEAISIINEQ